MRAQAGVHVATTLIPMLAEFYFSDSGSPQWFALAIYTPYFVLPLLLALRWWFAYDDGLTATAGKAKAV
jgi:hypothetical protein